MVVAAAAVEARGTVGRNPFVVVVVVVVVAAAAVERPGKTK